MRMLRFWSVVGCRLWSDFVRFGCLSVCQLPITSSGRQSFGPSLECFLAPGPRARLTPSSDRYIRCIQWYVPVVVAAVRANPISSKLGQRRRNWFSRKLNEGPPPPPPPSFPNSPNSSSLHRHLVCDWNETYLPKTAFGSLGQAFLVMCKSPYILCL